MKNPLISIVIPAYNSEKTIERCLDPLLPAQDVEVIVVDDGSTDGTLALIKRIAKLSNGIKVISKENSGAGSARNAGLDACGGSFVMFCDADDAYSADLLPLISRRLQDDNPPDLLCFNRGNVYPDGHVIFLCGEEHGALDTDWIGYLNECMTYRGHSVSVINKVYKRSIIEQNSIRFDTGLALSEDLLFNLQYLPHCVSFYVDFRGKYKRYLTDGSLT